MTNSVNEKIIDKIKKLLELATSPNENEAKHAMETAQRLMLRYSVSELDVKDTSKVNQSIIEETYQNDTVNRQVGLKNQMPDIVSTIAPIFGVYCLVNTRGTDVRAIKLFGFKTNLTIVKFALDSIIAQGMIEYKVMYRRYRTVLMGVSFWKGFATGLESKFGSHANNRETGIELYDKVKQFVSSKATGTFISENAEGIALNAGHEAGLKAELRSAIQTSNSGKLLN